MQRLIKNNLIFILIMLLIPGFTGCSTQTDKSGPQVKTAAAQKKKLEATTDITGVLVPNSTSNIASKISGTVKTINSDVGSSVKAGDVLITLDTKDLEAQLKQSEAALNAAKDKAEQDRISLQSAKDTVDATKKLLADQEEQAKITLDNAEKTLNRTAELFKSGSVSQSQLDSDKNKYDTAKMQYDMARVDGGSTARNQLEAVSGKYDLAKKQYDTSSGSALEQAEAAINTLKVQLSNATIVSPINGIVTNKNINAGEIASQGTTLITIADTSSLKLKGTVLQDNLPFLKQNSEIDVSVDIYPGKVYKGQITSIGPMAVGTGEYFPIEISINNSGDLKAGISAHSSLGITSDDTVVVPLSAVVQNNGQSYVFVIKNNVASKRIVKSGLKNDKEIEILKGLDGGEQVAVTNVNSLIDGMNVN